MWPLKCSRGNYSEPSVGQMLALKAQAKSARLITPHNSTGWPAYYLAGVTSSAKTFTVYSLPVFYSVLRVKPGSLLYSTVYPCKRCIPSECQNYTGGPARALSAVPYNNLLASFFANLFRSCQCVYSRLTLLIGP